MFTYVSRPSPPDMSNLIQRKLPCAKISFQFVQQELTHGLKSDFAKVKRHDLER